MQLSSSGSHCPVWVLLQPLHRSLQVSAAPNQGSLQGQRRQGQQHLPKQAVLLLSLPDFQPLFQRPKKAHCNTSSRGGSIWGY